jgi:hypothetical protein
VSWPREAFEALRQIVLIDHRVSDFPARLKAVAVTCEELDRRSNRLEAKLELLERMATPTRRALPEESEK